MQVPGALLLRDPSGGIYAVQTSSLQQVRPMALAYKAMGG